MKRDVLTAKVLNTLDSFAKKDYNGTRVFSMEKGYRKKSTSCPIASTLAHAINRSKIAVYGDGRVTINGFAWFVSKDVGYWVKRFDSGEYEEYAK